MNEQAPTADLDRRVRIFPARRDTAAILSGFLGVMWYPVLGIGLLLLLWWYAGHLIAEDPNTRAFAGFAPRPALASLWTLHWSGQLLGIVVPSLKRIAGGLLCATAVGIPVGVLVGTLAPLRRLSHVPFQLLRMISPLAWMPIAVLAFNTWNEAIIFLIFMASVWPVVFSTAFGVQRIDPLYFDVARNFGASPLTRLWYLLLPAIAPDICAGLRLALGIAWVVLVPAEYLGVTSGLGYAINDARDTLSYDRLAALVLVIGVIGFTLDAALMWLIRRYHWQGA